MINFKQYKVKKGVYRGVVTETITIPSDIVYLTGGEYDIGQFLSDGHCHYIGIVRGDYNDIGDQIKGLAVSVHKFNSEYCFVTLTDVQFISEAPEIINPDILPESQYVEKLAKWNSQIDFNKYYVAFYSKEFKLLKMAKIQQIKSENKINTCTVYAFNDCFPDIEYKSIDWSNMELCSFKLDGLSKNIISRVIEGEIADKCWNTLIYNVLKLLNLSFIDPAKSNTLQMSEINRSYKIAKDFIYNNVSFNAKELEDLLNMKIV